MPQQGLLRWYDGEGWLVLASSSDMSRGETDQIDARLLSVANLDRPMVVLLSDGSLEEAEAILEHYTLLGGPGGEAFTMANMTRDHLAAPDFLTLLEEAGILYLGGENPLPLVRNFYNSPALHRIAKGYATLQGLNIIGMNGGAAAMGAWLAPLPGLPQQDSLGIGFVLDSVVVPHFTQTKASPFVNHFPNVDANVLGLGIPDGAALALGPQAQVETWGLGQITAVIKANAMDAGE